MALPRANPTTRLLALAALLAPVAAQTNLEAGAAAPPGRWNTDGGCAASTGHSLAPPLRAEPEEAWHVDLRGPIEGEPRVWDGVVTLCVRESTTRRAIQRLELATGRTLLHQVLPSAIALEPVVWDDRLAVRPREGQVDLYRARGTRLFHLRSLRARTSISAPVVLEGTLYLRIDEELVAQDPDRNQPLWRLGPKELGARPRGRPAARGPHLYALAYDAAGNAQLLVVERRTGSVLGRADAGHHGGRVPELVDRAWLGVFGPAVFIEYPLPVPASSGRELATGRIPRRLDEQRVLRFGPGSLQDWVGSPTALERGWAMLERRGEQSRWVEGLPNDEGLRLTLLADAENHTYLTEAEAPATRAQDVLYLGGLACDLVTHEVLWRRDPPRQRPVPADRFLLVVESERRLTALRARPPARTPAEERVAQAVLELETRTAEGLAALARESLTLREPALTRRLIDSAVARGARGPQLDAARDGLERLPESDGAGPNRRRDALLAKERHLLGTTVRGLVERAGDARDTALRIAYLRAVLARDPQHEGARAAAVALLPPDLPATLRTDAGERAASWLDLLAVHRRTPLAITVDTPGARGASRGSALEVLRAQARAWRPDLVAWGSRRLLVVSDRATGPGLAARCLEIGELVCDLLEEVFGAQDESGEPMTLLLHATREEYIRLSTASRSGPEHGFGWTAGHYSSGENLSRMFLPADDADLSRLLGVYAHELTHHWLATRAPFASRLSNPELPFWIVEGFATMVEEFRLDPGAGTWDPVNPRAESLDVVANASEHDLLPWEDVLTMDHDAFLRLEAGAVASVPLSWRLGVRADRSAIGLYYAQAGALCHYLFRSSDADRQHLLGTVRAWYEQRKDRRAYGPFGRTAQELGHRVRTFARAEVAR